jgi:hypothetical protein
LALTARKRKQPDVKRLERAFSRKRMKMRPDEFRTHLHALSYFKPARRFTRPDTF